MPWNEISGQGLTAKLETVSMDKPFMNCVEAFVLTIVVAGCYLMVSPM